MKTVTVTIADKLLSVFDLAKQGIGMTDTELVAHCFELGFEALIRGATKEVEAKENDTKNPEKS